MWLTLMPMGELGERKEYAGTLHCATVADSTTMGHESKKPKLSELVIGNQGHYRSDCPELKNQNLGNQAEGTKARGMVYALGGGETDQDLNNI
ncbi:hypothetical protein Tco_1217286 [Tanacetum coccineum]